MAEAWIYVLWGQSNAVGAGTSGVPSIYQTPDPGILLFPVTGAETIAVYAAGVNSNTISGGVDQKWGPEAEFARRHRMEFPGRPIYILKYAQASSMADSWLPSLDLLFLFLKNKLDALKAILVSQGLTPVVKAILGMQGEGDCADPAKAAAYEANKNEFYTEARAQWGDSNTRFVDGRVSASPVNIYGGVVRLAQLLAAGAEQDALLVDTDSLPLNSDNLHYSNSGIQTLGLWFYQAYRTASPATIVFLSFPQEAIVASSNRTQLTTVPEVTLGTTPTTPRMRIRRLTGEALAYRPTFEEPNELRADRMVADETLVGTETTGTINWELHYPYSRGPLDIDFRSSFYNPWVEQNSRDNDGTADSVVTNVDGTGKVVTVTTGTSFFIGQLVRFTDFTNAVNNSVFRVTTASATAPVFGGTALVTEAAPPAAARMKVVGISATVAADISATATGLASTVVNFVAVGIIPGMWLKVGGTVAGSQFATAANNTWIRATVVSANAITADHLPSGWSVDAGTGKTVFVFFGDQIKNGVIQASQSIEKAFLGQATPTYILMTGMVTTQMSLNYEAHRKITGQSTYLGMGGTQSTTTQDASPDAALALASYPVFASSANVGRVSEGGSPLVGPNFVRALNVTINNNVTAVDDIGTLGPAGITGHECQVTGTMNTYFGDNSLLTKFFNGTPTSIVIIVTKGNQALILTIPRAVYNGDGSPQATGKNIDVMLNLGFRASKDEVVTNAQVLFDRLEYFES